MKYMSQKERNFQSKPKRDRQNFGDRPKSRGRFEKRDFSERSEGDRGERPKRSFTRSYDRDDRAERPRPYRDSNKPGSDRPRGKSFEKRDFERRDSRSSGDGFYKKRDFDGESRRDSGDRPYQKRPFGDKKEGRDRDFRPRDRKEFGDRGDRPQRKFDRDSGDRPYQKRPFGDKKEGRGKDFKPRDRKEFGSRDDRPQKSFERYEETPRRSATAETRQKLKSDRPSYGAPSTAYLYGVHAVTQALLNPKRVHKRLFCTQKSFEELEETWQDAADAGITLPEVMTVEREDIDRLVPRDAVHQDLLLDCKPLPETSLFDLLENIPNDAKVLVLDQVTDPHNIGAILRSAAAFGAIAVVMQTLHAPEVTGTLAKSASGALEHVPLVREVNLSRALEQLKESGFFCIGLAEGGKQTLAQLKLTGKTALVLGAEGSGLRRLVAENCDELVKLPTQEPIASLNVSNAAAIALYELIRKD